MARNDLIISTSDKVETGVAGRSLQVPAGNSIQLKGSLFLAQMGSEFWAPGPHVIEYDAARTSRADDLYSVTVSPRATFVRVTGGDKP